MLTLLTLFFSMLAIKTAPKILYKDVTSIIGSPDDYKNNKNANKFPDSYDIRIPTAIRPEILEIPKEDEEIEDLSQPEPEKKS